MESSLTKKGNVGESEGGDCNSKDLEGDDVVESEDNAEQTEGGEILEPYEGMEFDSEEDARKFYNDYAARVGFVVRMMQRRLSPIDGRTVARHLACNKQGFSSTTTDGKIGPARKPRPNAREGCNAAILVRQDNSGKWVVTRFLKDHNHPLVVTNREYTGVCDKDKKIQELTRELRREEELCATYREKLINLMANVENQGEHLSLKIHTVAQNIQKAEAEAFTHKNNR